MTRPRFHPLRVAVVRALAADAVTLGFAVPAALRDAYRFRPGQYLTLRATVAGRDVRRSYSICSGLDDDTLRVGIKRVEGGVFSTWACSELSASPISPLQSTARRLRAMASMSPTFKMRFKLLWAEAS